LPSDIPKIPKARAGHAPGAPDVPGWATRYLGIGWNVIPVGRDKRPALGSWKEYQTRRVTEGEIRRWWTERPAAGVAILTGALSGVIVVDADSEEGSRAVRKLMNGPTLEARTGGGGTHYYFRHPGGRVPSLVRFMPGVDCRGDGGYVVAPPSGHPSGGLYSWVNWGTVPAPLPPALAARLRSGARRNSVDWGASVPKGTRDQELTRRAGKLLRAGLTPRETLDVLVAVNAAYCRPPLPAEQVRKIVRSIAAREAERRTTERKGAFTVLPQREMLRRYAEDETRWTIVEWLPEGACGLLVAPPGNYKTWLLAAVAFSVSTGEPFLGRWAVHAPGPVLFIQQEDPWSMLESRLSRMFVQEAPSAGAGQDPEYRLDCRFVERLDSMPVYWYTDRRLRFSDRDVVAAMERTIANLRPRVVLIDPLYTAADSRDYMAESAQRMAELKVMRDKYGCSFIVAHHTTVAGAASKDRSAIWGSQFLNAWLEFGWRLPEGYGDGNVIIRHFKATQSPSRLRVKFRITEWSFGAETEEDRATDADEIEVQILTGALRPVVGDITKKTGCSRATAYRVLRKLKEEGKI